MQDREYQDTFGETVDRGRYLIDKTSDKDALERAARDFGDLKKYAENKAKGTSQTSVGLEEFRTGILSLFLSSC